jgi:hypothetical protein
MCEIVPVTLAAACTATGELTVDPLAGLHMFTPGLLGAVQPVPPPPPTVAFATVSHFVPAVLIARTAKR